MIRLAQVCVRFGDVVAVDHVDLRIERGELLVLLGESGCGKTTTLKAINRLVEPDSGHIEIDGVDTRDIEAHVLRRGIGYVFQEVGLFPHLDVASNAGIALELTGVPADERDLRVRELLRIVDLDPDAFGARMPDELSGGQRQRVGLARALAARPRIVLLDEPFGALDPMTRDNMQGFFTDLRRELELTCVFVTHDMVEALLLGDRIAVMDEGRLLQVGTPQEMLTRPADPVVARLMDSPRRQSRIVERLLEASGEPEDAERAERSPSAARGGNPDE